MRDYMIVSDMSSIILCHSNVDSTLRTNIEEALNLDHGALLRALVRKSETTVRQLLCSSKNLVSEKGRRGETPLHVATTWPKGLELLLELGGDVARSLIDMADLDGYTPLDYACLLDQPGSANILLGAGGSIDLENLAMLEISPEAPLYSEPLSDDIVILFAEELAKRRKLLLHLALTHLRENEIAAFNLREQSLLQEHAFDVIQLLRRQHIDIPRCFRTVRRGSIYHSPWMSEILADALFNVGFDHTNVVVEGFTPLMTVSLQRLIYRRGLGPALDLITWMEEHGADIHAQIPTPSRETATMATETSRSRFEVIHRIGYFLGYTSYASVSANLDRRHNRQLQRIIVDEPNDACNCYCAPGGCTPAVLCARALLGRYASIYQRRTTVQYMDHWSKRTLDRILRDGLRFAGLMIKGENSHPLVEAILRVATFNRLGMKHTCCIYPPWFAADGDDLIQMIREGHYQIVEVMDSAEIDEIQQEDRYLEIQLQKLVEEFLAKFRDGDVAFLDFFYGYWWTRMDEIEREHGGIPDSELQAIRDIGVALDGES